MSIEYVKLLSNSINETAKLAEKLSTFLEPGDVITLEGELGTGKTAFTKGIAKGLGVKEPVTSPTFTIIKEYVGKYPFYHMDVYRLENSEEDIGFMDYFHGGGIVVVEWAQFIEQFLPSERMNIKIDYLDENRRQFVFHAKGSRYKEIIKKLKESFK